jgi:hypothetical protein
LGEEFQTSYVQKEPATVHIENPGIATNQVAYNISRGMVSFSLKFTKNAPSMLLVDAILPMLCTSRKVRSKT